jgi:hypothetical protein
MADETINRTERREEIKLKLEYAKLISVVALFITVVFAGLQWRIANQTAAFANQIANENAYQRIATEWRDHLKTFVDKPNVRPYFEEGKQLNVDDPDRQLVLALADVRLDVMDAILTYAALRGAYSDIEGWKRTVASAFRTSPVLCARLSEMKSNFGLIVPIHETSCSR